MSSDKVSRIITLASVAALPLLLVVALVGEQWQGVLMIAVLLAPVIYFCVFKRRVPEIFQAVFAVAMLCNGIVYAFALFSAWEPLDKIVHFYSGFAVTLAPGTHVFRRVLVAPNVRAVTLVITLSMFGLAIAAAWEVAEWLLQMAIDANIIRGVADTRLDMITSAAGGFLAAIVAVYWYRSAR